MTLFSILLLAVGLVVIGILLQVANTRFPMYPTILQILNISVITFVIIFVLLFFLQAFNLIGPLQNLRIN